MKSTENMTYTAEKANPTKENTNPSEKDFKNHDAEFSLEDPDVFDLLGVSEDDTNSALKEKINRASIKYRREHTLSINTLDNRKSIAKAIEDGDFDKIVEKAKPSQPIWLKERRKEMALRVATLKAAGRWD